MLLVIAPLAYFLFVSFIRSTGVYPHNNQCADPTLIITHFCTQKIPHLQAKQQSQNSQYLYVKV